MLFLTAVTLFFLRQKRKDTGERVTVVYTVVFETEDVLASQIASGDLFVDARTKEPFGQVIKCTVEEQIFEDVYGIYQKEGRVRVALSLCCEGERSDKGISLGKTPLRAGDTVCLLGKTKWEALCVKVRAI